MPNKATRRQVLKAAGQLAGIFAAGPVWGLNPKSVGANERIRIALVGCGLRATQLMNSRPDGCQVVIAVDADLSKAKKMATLLPGEVAYGDDYHAAFERDDLDGAMVATTEPHHVQAGMAACEAGLDAYVEKPMSLYFAEGRSLVSAARRHGRIVQVGTQQRSMEMNQFACELVRDGGIGEVRVVETVNYSSPRPFPENGFQEQTVPAGLNWDRWQGCAPAQPFNKRLYSHYLEPVS